MLALNTSTYMHVPLARSIPARSKGIDHVGLVHRRSERAMAAISVSLCLACAANYITITEASIGLARAAQRAVSQALQNRVSLADNLRTVLFIHCACITFS